MDIAGMMRLKEQMHFTYEAISQASGIPLATVQKVLSGQTRDPRHATMTSIEKGLIKLCLEKEQEQKNESGTDEPLMAREEAVPLPVFREGDLARKIPVPEVLDDWDPTYRPKVRYSLVDYQKIPDDLRVELIDGVFYNMSAPLIIHQMLVSAIGFPLYQYTLETGGPCQVLMSPTDVLLDDDMYTIVQPDILIICDPSKVSRRNLRGAPDLIVEILSPGSVRKDTVLKLKKYLSAGVREYWIVDPDRKKVLVYRMGEDAWPMIYSFDDQIPVGIWNGECIIDMRKISERVFGEDWTGRP